MYSGSGARRKAGGGDAARGFVTMFHPAVRFAYLSAAILFAMLAFQPVYVAISLGGALAASCAVRGAAATLRGLGWIAGLAALVAAGNLVFVSAGSTELFSLFGRRFYLEALCFGLTSGGVLAAMLLWFSVYAAVMDSEATSAVMGPALPLVSLMISQVMRLVPQFARRGRAIAAAEGATTAARVGADSRPARRRSRLRVLTALLGWGMEDGIVRARSMSARGFGCGPARTRYRRHRFALRDGAALAVVAALLAALSAGNAFLAAVATSQFGFYPYLDTLVAWWGYIPYAAFALLPAALAAIEAISWR